MTTYILNTGKHLLTTFCIFPKMRFWRFAILAFITIFFLLPYTHDIVSESIQDAFYGVSVFVLATLITILGVEKVFHLDFNRVMKQAHSYQVLLAGFLGATPGCGGAVIVTVQYARGYVSFGSLVATLTATMGDAAFLLLVRDPYTGFLVISMTLSVGIIFGYIVDYFKGVDYLSKKSSSVDVSSQRTQTLFSGERQEHINMTIFSFFRYGVSVFFTLIFIPGFIIGVLGLLQWSSEDIAMYFSIPISFVEYLALIAMFFMLILWVFNIFPDSQQVCMNTVNSQRDKEEWSFSERLIGDSCLISALVVFAFSLYEVGMFLSDFSLESFFNTIPVWLPLLAILVGFIPGCGPQIVVTSLYLTGTVPFSALIGNAMSNDGDALFPALAIAPRASLYATLYTAIPAFIVAYAWYFFVEVQ